MFAQTVRMTFSGEPFPVHPGPDPDLWLLVANCVTDTGVINVRQWRLLEVQSRPTCSVFARVGFVCLLA